MKEQAQQIVRDYLPLAAGAGLIPIPGVDLAAVGGLQLKVLSSLAEFYGVPFTRCQAQSVATSLVGAVGVAVLSATMILSAVKAIPGLGTVLGATSLPLAGSAVTHAIGHLAIEHFEAGGTMDNFDLDLAHRVLGRRIAEARDELSSRNKGESLA